MTRRLRFSGKTRGYTLMEALVLLSMLGILVVISFPNLIRWADRMRLDGAARQTAMFLSLARLKAVSHGFPYTVDLVPPGGNYNAVQISSRFASLVIRGREDNPNTVVVEDLNGNGVAGELEDPVAGGVPNQNLVMVYPAKVILGATVPAPIPFDACNPTTCFPPPQLVFRSNGQVDLAVTAGQTSLSFIVYLTNASNDWYAISVWHSGRIKIHQYRPSPGGWTEVT